MVKMKRLRHYKFISSIRIRVVPALQLLGEAVATGWRARPGSGGPFVSPRGRLGRPHTLSKNYFLSGARQLGRIIWGGFYVAKQSTLWDSRRLLRIHFHPWPQTMPCPRPCRGEATVAWAESPDLRNNPPWHIPQSGEWLRKQVLLRR